MAFLIAFSTWAGRSMAACFFLLAALPAAAALAGFDAIFYANNVRRLAFKGAEWCWTTAEVWFWAVASFREASRGFTLGQAEYYYM